MTKHCSTDCLGLFITIVFALTVICFGISPFLLEAYLAIKGEPLNQTWSKASTSWVGTEAKVYDPTKCYFQRSLFSPIIHSLEKPVVTVESCHSLPDNKIRVTWSIDHEAHDVDVMSYSTRELIGHTKKIGPNKFQIDLDRSALPDEAGIYLWMSYPALAKQDRPMHNTEAMKVYPDQRAFECAAHEFTVRQAGEFRAYFRIIGNSIERAN